VSTCQATSVADVLPPETSGDRGVGTHLLQLLQHEGLGGWRDRLLRMGRAAVEDLVDGEGVKAAGALVAGRWDLW
jgi:hypothetical protein